MTENANKYETLTRSSYTVDLYLELYSLLTWLTFSCRVPVKQRRLRSRRLAAVINCSSLQTVDLVCGFCVKVRWLISRFTLYKTTLLCNSQTRVLEDLYSQ